MSEMTIVTVTWNTWETYTSRLIESVFHYVNPDDYYEWIMVDSDSADCAKILRSIEKFPDEHRDKFTLICSDDNISDLPQYNRIIPNYVKTSKVLCLSTDMRIWDVTVKYFDRMLSAYPLVGERGPSMPKSWADPEIGGEWHWIPQLLISRGIEFEKTDHVQSHCIGIDKKAFEEVGGFWEPEDGNFLDKGNLVSGEISLSVKMRQAGYSLGYCTPPYYHYGNTFETRETIDQYDRRRGWLVPFKRWLT